MFQALWHWPRWQLQRPQSLQEAKQGDKLVYKTEKETLCKRPRARTTRKNLAAEPQGPWAWFWASWVGQRLSEYSCKYCQTLNFYTLNSGGYSYEIIFATLSSAFFACWTIINAVLLIEHWIFANPLFSKICRYCEIRKINGTGKFQVFTVIILCIVYTGVQCIDSCHLVFKTQNCLCAEANLSSSS